MNEGLTDLVSYAGPFTLGTLGTSCGSTLGIRNDTLGVYGGPTIASPETAMLNSVCGQMMTVRLDSISTAKVEWRHDTASSTAINPPRASLVRLVTKDGQDHLFDFGSEAIARAVVRAIFEQRGCPPYVEIYPRGLSELAAPPAPGPGEEI